jgi:hypothetical protein
MTKTTAGNRLAFESGGGYRSMVRASLTIRDVALDCDGVHAGDSINHGLRRHHGALGLWGGAQG